MSSTTDTDTDTETKDESEADGERETVDETETNGEHTEETATLLEGFLERLATHSVTATVVDREHVETAIADELHRPAVGTSLPFEGVSVPDVVETNPTPDAITSAETGVTAGLLGVADYGSVVVTSSEECDGPISLYPPKHIAVIRRRDIVPDMTSALAQLTATFETGLNDAVFVTGRSSTGDMGASVVGVHGPSAMHVVVIDE